MPLTALALLRTLAAYDPRDAAEADSVERIREFLSASPETFLRPNPAGHVTASAVLAREPGPEFLLLWHRKLARWLQPGGHVEASDDSVFAAALREAREETGIDSFEFPITDRLLDVDVHPIPAHGDDPPHFHYDFRHLFTVPLSTRARGERAGVRGADGIRWFTFDEALTTGIDSSLERALRKATDFLHHSIGNRQSSIVNS